MPVVYLALANNGKPLPAFSQKKIGNRMPGPAGEVPVSVFAGFVFFPVMAFRFLIAAFASNSTIASSSGFFFNAFKSLTSLNRLFDVPVASIRFGDLQKDQVETLKGMALQSDLTNQNIFVGSPSLLHLNQINALRPVDDRIRPGHVSFDGYLAWTYLMKGIHILTTVMNPMSADSYSHFVSAESSLAGGTTGRVSTIDSQVASEYVNVSDQAVAQNQGQLLFVAPDNDWSAFNGSFIDAHSFKNSLHGIFFPFFLGMSVPDKTTAYQVFSSIFSGSIASTAVATASLLQRIRSGVRQLAFSRSGMVMAHAYACIGLALQVPNSKVHVVLKGNVYCGVVIEGNFSISLYGTLVESGETLQDIQSINLLETQAERIVALLNAVEDGEISSVYTFAKDDFMTSRKALRNWNSIDRSLFHSSDTLKAVETILSEMEFNDNFSVPTTKMVDQFLSFVMTGDVRHISDHPAYLSGVILQNSSRVYEGLSIFGPKALSVNVGDKKGLTFVIGKPGKSDPNLDIDPESKKRKLQYIPLCLTPVATAAKQWNMLFGSGNLCLSQPRKGKKEFTAPVNLTHKVADDPNFTDMYNQIKGIVNENRKARKGDSGGEKRKGGVLSGKGKKAKVSVLVEDMEI